MNDSFDFFLPDQDHSARRQKRSKYGRQTSRQAESFQCGHCRNHVTTISWISGVQNRNHCPYCLWSKHLDLEQAGDRLAACKAKMRPVGVALKRAHKKYGEADGELMLVHLCMECGKVSLNRIAADDDPQAILAVFEASCNPKSGAATENLPVLGADHADLVHARLFGRGVRVPVTD